MLLAAEPGTIFLLVILVAIFLLVKGVANPYARPFLIGLGALVVVAMVLLYFSFHSVQVEQSSTWVQERHGQETIQAQLEAAKSMARSRQEAARAMIQSQQEAARSSDRAVIERVRQVEAGRTAAVRAPQPPKTSAAEMKPPKTTLVTALGDAVFQAWTGRKPRADVPAPVIRTAEKVKTPSQPDPPAKSQPPAWVNAQPKMQGDVYLMTLHVGPFTTPLECERDLPEALQKAVADYAELLLGREQAKAVHLLDGTVRRLELQRWLETRPLEINGIAQDMATLHVLVGFDPAMQQQIRATAEHAIVDRRLQASGVVLAGVLGLLVLVWAGLTAIGKRPAANQTQETATPAENKGGRFPFVLLGGLFAAAVVLAILLLGR